MGKIIFVTIGLLIGFTPALQSSADQADNKGVLIDQIQHWVAGREQVTADAVEVRALDRRLVVPNCNQPYTIDYPFQSSRQTVRVTCPQQPWKLFIGIEIHQSHAVWVYTRDIEANATLQKADLELTFVPNFEKGLLADASALLKDNRNFSLSTAVSAGDLVREHHLLETVNVFRIKRDILKGETISATDVSPSPVALVATHPHQRFPLRLLGRAKALRDLASDSILSRRDFSVGRPALVSLKALSRGEKLNDSNTRIADYFGELPRDVAVAHRDVEHMQATRNIKAGQLIRLSDLRPGTLFNQGDSVLLTILRDNLSVTVEMIALEDGRIDQQVKLLNPESQKTVAAIVTGPGSARGL